MSHDLSGLKTGDKAVRQIDGKNETVIVKRTPKRLYVGELWYDFAGNCHFKGNKVNGGLLIPWTDELQKQIDAATEKEFKRKQKEQEEWNRRRHMAESERVEYWTKRIMKSAKLSPKKKKKVRNRVERVLRDIWSAAETSSGIDDCTRAEWEL